MKKIKIYAFADEASSMIDEQICAMKRNNLNGLEIRNVDGVNISDISIDKAKEVKKKLDDADLGVWSIGSPIGKIGINDELNHKEYLAQDLLFRAQKIQDKKLVEEAFILATDNIAIQKLADDLNLITKKVL